MGYLLPQPLPLPIFGLGKPLSSPDCTHSPAAHYRKHQAQKHIKLPCFLLTPFPLFEIPFPHLFASQHYLVWGQLKCHFLFTCFSCRSSDHLGLNPSSMIYL